MFGPSPFVVYPISSSICSMFFFPFCYHSLYSILKLKRDIFFQKLIRLVFETTINVNRNCTQYQCEENGYYPRSFEDAFINVNLAQIKANLGSIRGLKNEDEFDTCSDMYLLTSEVIEEKSDFASALLFLTHAKGLNWKTPAYIWEGLEWLQKQTH